MKRCSFSNGSSNGDLWIRFSLIPHQDGLCKGSIWLSRGEHFPTKSTIVPSLQDKNVFPAIGLVHFPFLAAFISANNAGLMPFFLHFFISSGVKPLMSCELAVHVLLDRELPASEGGYREGVPDDMVLEALEELERYDVWSTETVRSMTSLSAPPSVPTESFLLPGFHLCSMPLGGYVSAELTGVVGCIDCRELTLAVRNDPGNEVGFGGSLTGGGPRSTSGVMGYSSSRVNIEGEGVSTSSDSATEAIVVTEAMVSREVRLRSRG